MKDDLVGWINWRIGLTPAENNHFLTPPTSTKIPVLSSLLWSKTQRKSYATCYKEN